MNDQERDVIADIFRRLEQVAGQPRDPEAERFIADRIRQQPYAPYAMAQTIFVQERALTNLNEELEALRAEVEELRRQPQPSGGILSSLFGGGPRPADAQPMGRQASPWGVPAIPQRQQAYGDPGMAAPGGAPPSAGAHGGPWGGGMGQPQRPGFGGGGGFLQGALTTAAGVAGGMMLGNVLTNAFGGKGTEAAAGEKTSLADTAAAENPTDNSGITDSLYEHPAQEQPDDYADFGGDSGDEGDWA
ncbi:DUF2076 family protein [Microvirga antarctica]|uniref:DUF2076 family protein n=1 Tax=Microvirga antarctica TaxID=2819233 RepID=UPI001B30A58D